ncbi:MAG: phenylalanine--tRNA ligase subunit alpha [Candidatus Thorarchaeota archaeon]
MSEQLTSGEKMVLSELVKIGQRILATTLAQQLKEKDERVLSILNSLAQRGLVKLHTQTVVSYTLIDEGTDYAVFGLPELRLFRAVEELGGKSSLEQAVEKSGISPRAKGIAINWARKNGWLSITKEDGETILEIKTTSIETELQDLLTKMEGSGGTLRDDGSQLYKQLLDRNLVEEEIEKSFEASVVSDRMGEIDSLLADTLEGIGDLTPEMLLDGAWRDAKFRPYNVESTPPYINYGKKHPYAEFNDWLREILVGLGFSEWSGPYVETEFWNNDSLFVPQDHVAREVQDQFKVTLPYSHGSILDKKYYRAVKAVHENGGDTGSKGWEAPFSEEVAKRLCLRAHTTPVSMRYLWEHRESPQKMFIVDRNFRSETLSARHAQEFNQCEGIIMDKGLTLRDLLGYLSEICRRVGIKKTKYKPGQFPFTEPSVEVFAKHDVLGWIEVAPGGIFRPEVTYPLGIKDPVLAWGIGSGRLYMASMGINDIRELYSRDLSWVRRKYFVR